MTHRDQREGGDDDEDDDNENRDDCQDGMPPRGSAARRGHRSSARRDSRNLNDSRLSRHDVAAASRAEDCGLVDL